MRISRYGSILAVALLVSPALAQNYDLPIREHVFENGLRLLVIERPGERRVVSKIFTDMGALNETPGQFGAAHFLEHLMFKGTQTLGSADWEREKALHEHPNLLNAYRLMASAQGMLNNYAEARAAYEYVVKLVPGVTIAATLQGEPFAFDDDAERFAEGLRRAGMPEE